MILTSDRVSEIETVLRLIVYLSLVLGLSATFIGSGSQVDGSTTNNLLFQSLVVSNIFAFSTSSGALMIRNKHRWRGVFLLYSFISLLCTIFSFGILLYAWGSVNIGLS